MTRTPYALAGIFAASLVLAACGHDHDHDNVIEELPPPETTTSEEGRPVQVAVSTTVLGDITDQIVACAGDGSVTVLMPVGADPHDYALSSAQVADLVQADLVITNGLQLESGMESALEGAKGDGARIFEVAPRVDPIPFGENGDSHGHDDDKDDHGHDDDHDHGDLDPHFWLDMGRMATAATVIATELGVVTGEADTFTTCGEQVAGEIRAAEDQVRATLDSVPEDQRVIITDHDAFGYFAQEYNYEIAGTVIPTGTTLAAPSSADLADLANTIREENISVIFANVAEPAVLAEALASEVGANVTVVPLFVGTLGAPGSGADSYIGMMTTNADLIASNLRN